MRSGKCIDAKSALPEITMKSSLRQEIVRRMSNLHLDLHFDEKIGVLDNFYDKMAHSGHDHDFIRSIFVEGWLKFEFMVKNSKLDPSNPDYKPLYMPNKFNEVGRASSKFMRRFNWYDPTDNPSNNSWKSEIPPNLENLT